MTKQEKHHACKIRFREGFASYLAHKLLDERSRSLDFVKVGLDLTVNARNDLGHRIQAVAVHLVGACTEVEPCTLLLAVPQVERHGLRRWKDKLDPRQMQRLRQLRPFRSRATQSVQPDDGGGVVTLRLDLHSKDHRKIAHETPRTCESISTQCSARARIIAENAEDLPCSRP